MLANDLNADRTPKPLKATHGAEIPYVYGVQDELPTEAEHVLSQNMIDYYISFVVNLDPNDKNGNASRKPIDIHFEL